MLQLHLHRATDGTCMSNTPDISDCEEYIECTIYSSIRRVPGDVPIAVLLVDILDGTTHIEYSSNCIPSRLRVVFVSCAE